MVVRGNTVFLRTVREDDLNDLYGRLTDIELRGPYFPISIPSESGFKAQFREDGFWSDTNGIMLICANDDGRILGQIMRFKATPYWDNYEIGYRLLDMSERGHGFTSEALMLFTYILFAASSVHRLELKIVPDNLASRRVAEKCGYRLEGTAREAVFMRGVHRDMMIYSLLRQEGPTTLAEALARLSVDPAV